MMSQLVEIENEKWLQRPLWNGDRFVDSSAHSRFRNDQLFETDDINSYLIVPRIGYLHNFIDQMFNTFGRQLHGYGALLYSVSCPDNTRKDMMILESSWTVSPSDLAGIGVSEHDLAKPPEERPTRYSVWRADFSIIPVMFMILNQEETELFQAQSRSVRNNYSR